jgi:hypothetical protein
MKRQSMDRDVLFVVGAKLESRSRGSSGGLPLPAWTRKQGSCLPILYKQVTGDDYTLNSEAEGGIAIVCHYYLFIFGYIPSNENNNDECAQLLMSDVVLT